MYGNCIQPEALLITKADNGFIVNFSAPNPDRVLSMANKAKDTFEMVWRTIEEGKSLKQILSKRLQG